MSVRCDVCAPVCLSIVCVAESLSMVVSTVCLSLWFSVEVSLLRNMGLYSGFGECGRELYGGGRLEVRMEVEMSPRAGDERPSGYSSISAFRSGWLWLGGLLVWLVVVAVKSGDDSWVRVSQAEDGLAIAGETNSDILLLVFYVVSTLLILFSYSMYFYV